MLSGIKVYRFYTKYWISRHFVEVFGFGILFNNFRILNNIFKFDDIGDMKKIGWFLAEFDKGLDSTILNRFLQIYDNLDEESKSFVDYHLGIAADGFKQRSEHFRVCADMLKSINNYLGTDYIDNIYNLNKLFKKYHSNVFEEKIYNKEENTFKSFDEFMKIIKDDTKLEFMDEEYGFECKECSI